MARPNLIDMNSVELIYYPFVISLNKCAGSYNALSPKICVPKEKKYIYCKTFTMIKNRDGAKKLAENISYDCKYKFNSTTCNSNQKQNNKTRQ